MTDPRVKALCDEFDIEVIDGRRYPEPGQTRAVTTISRIISRHGEAHTRLVLMTLAEGKGNQWLIDEVTLWCISDLVRACADIVEERPSDFLDLMDQVPLGPYLAITNELRSVVRPQRAALVGMIYLHVRRLRDDSLTGKAADYHKASRTNASEREKGRPPFSRCWRTPQERIEVGRQLMAKKAELPRGEFARWLEGQEGIAAKTAHKYMKLAREAGAGVGHN
ncbi:DUF3102 domain-containing protein [Mesorhizobium sp. ASY16-5R]|uniref:DUF3102 domain-containing protein n=1 Tax=Mesorhizobium sp. ASY16-5R TaxID=3445772 RepID=UPI003F9EC20B